ncbi:DoxX family protein [Prosthecobacter sp.]|uniref:DoxX family protein n=1 Tax=Prosthecobacter sp. TaxID=1965333 RepID=UPI003784B2D9
MKTALTLVSALSFIGYGTACLVSSLMRQEFVRYGLGAQRVGVGLLQWAAGMGLLAGLWVPWMGRAAACGLALMMLAAVGVRVKIRDSAWQTTPALFYLVLNAYLFLADP